MLKRNHVYQNKYGKVCRRDVVFLNYHYGLSSIIKTIQGWKFNGDFRKRGKKSTF